MKKTKFDWGGYFKPTPKLWRKLGDTLLGISVFVTGAGIIGKLTWLPAAAMVIGVAGKFLTNFFVEGDANDGTGNGTN